LRLDTETRSRRRYPGAAVAMIESPAEIEKGQRRPKHEGLDAVYFFRPTAFNLTRLLEDYRVDVERDSRDFFERLFPCIFRGIGTVEPEPAWYSDYRLLVLPGVPSKDTPYDYRTARNWIDLKVDYEKDSLARVPRCAQRGRQAGAPSCGTLNRMQLLRRSRCGVPSAA